MVNESASACPKRKWPYMYHYLKKIFFLILGQFLVILDEKCTHQTVTKLTLTSTEPRLCLLGYHLTILNIVTYP